MIGDFKIKLCGEEYNLRPSFNALAEVESIGRPIFDVLVSYTHGQYSLVDTNNILFCCMKAYYGKEFPLTLPDVGCMIKAEGLNHCAPIAAECISTLLSGDEEEKKRVGEGAKEKMKKLNQAIK